MDRQAIFKLIFGGILSSILLHPIAGAFFVSFLYTYTERNDPNKKKTIAFGILYSLIVLVLSVPVFALMALAFKKIPLTFTTISISMASLFIFSIVSCIIGSFCGAFIEGFLQRFKK